MSEHSEFQRFADRLLSGEDRAARELLARYSAKLISLASARLNSRLRSKLDSEDVLQSVMRSFFRQLRAGEVELRNWEGLWGLLTLMTLRKCSRHAARYVTAQRDVALEVSFADPGDSGCAGPVVPSREPSPEEAALLADTVNHLLSTLDDSDREVVERLLGGQSTSEIAAARNCSERTVQRTIHRVRRRLMKRNGDA